MPDAFGSLNLTSNGFSYVKFHLEVEMYQIKQSKIEEKFVYSLKTSLKAICKFRENVGTWTSGIPGTMNLEVGMEEKLVQHRAKKILRVVTVIQPPFIQWNVTTSKIKKRKSMLLVYVSAP